MAQIWNKTVVKLNGNIFASISKIWKINIWNMTKPKDKFWVVAEKYSVNSVEQTVLRIPIDD